MDKIEYLMTGIALGFAAGISPGPLLVLVITETLKHNRKAGIKMAFVPLLSDVPIVLFSVFIIYQVSGSDFILGMISLLGALFLIYLAFENIRMKSIRLSRKNETINGFRKGVVVNLLSPHPYLFWMLVGAPLSMKAYHEHVFSAVLFVIGFYISIIGTKVVIAYISDQSKNILSENSYIVVVKILGFVLFFFALILLKDGLLFLNIINTAFVF
ncbi:MAG: LysE family transporter [Bacteroidales bacterium]|jgi:threonine/homoserine/homoserine lactone efflux protein|nr:LysE family transporter [Bacteroidales bacterium]